MSTNGYRILSLSSEAVQRLKAVNITPPIDAPLIEITGNNEQGKSSILDSITMAMSGKDATSFNPIHNGEEKARITVEIGDEAGKPKYRVTKSFTKKGEYIKVESADGAIYKSPQALIAGWKNDFTLDPLKFANAKPEEQRAMLMQAISLPVTAERIKEICGVEVKVDQANPLAAIESARKEIEKIRREKGRDLLKEKGAAEAIVIADQYKDAVRIDAQEILAKKTELQSKKDANQAERDKLADILQAGTSLKQARKNLNDREKELEEQIKKAQERLAALNAQVVETDKKIDAARKDYEAQQKVVEGLVEPDMSELDRKIEEAQKVNEAVFQREQKEQHMASLKTLREEYDGMTCKLDALDKYREELLEKANIPVPGLSIDAQGVVTFEGVPISQRGKSKRVLIGLAVCASLNPKVRTVLVYDGNDLDATGMQTVYDWAKEHDFQVWLERIDRRGRGVAFEIVDGSVKE